jgi:hypothetical protein
MDINVILTQISQGPYKEEFYQYFGQKNKLYLHQHFDPLSKYFFYVRQSKNSDDITSKEWQISNLGFNGPNNIIVSSNSAYKNKKADYILDIIKYIVQSGNKNFTLSVSDYSRFSRNIETTEKIYNYLYDNQVEFYLNVDGKIYNYLNDYYTNNLRKTFTECQKFSDELSREMKKVHKKKKEIKVKNKYSGLATSYFKWFMTHRQDFIQPKMFNTLGRIRFSPHNMDKYFKETDGLFENKDEFFYFYCPYTNLMIVCPEELAYIEGLDSSIIKGFDKDDLFSLADSDIESLNYICYHRDNFDMNNMDLDLI